jgi:L-galactose dehydrogenase/L-glyceraldehyde 3-phosphate reductase
MERRPLGRTGLGLSALGFGCGDVGGLMVRGGPAERERAVARAIELGIDYFDTAPSYGRGQSEINLGRALKAVGADVHVGTKVRLGADEVSDIEGAIRRSLEASLTRLGASHVDLLQLHNRIAGRRGPDTVSERDVLDAVVPAIDRLRAQGKVRFCGITALGETEALHRVVGAGAIDAAQTCLNLLNPSAARPLAPGFPAQDFRQLIGAAHARGVGAIVIRVFAAGALSGTLERHPVAMPTVDPIATGPDYAADVRRARAFRTLVDEGHVGSVVEAALRFPLGIAGVSTVLLGSSTVAQLEAAAAAVERGPLPAPTLERFEAIWRRLAADAARS